MQKNQMKTLKTELNNIWYDIKKIFEKDKCNPEKYNIDYCQEFWEVYCKRTCNYAQDLIKLQSEHYEEDNLQHKKSDYVCRGKM